MSLSAGSANVVFPLHSQNPPTHCFIPLHFLCHSSTFSVQPTFLLNEPPPRPLLMRSRLMMRPMMMWVLSSSTSTSFYSPSCSSFTSSRITLYHVTLTASIQSTSVPSKSPPLPRLPNKSKRMFASGRCRLAQSSSSVRPVVCVVWRANKQSSPRELVWVSPKALCDSIAATDFPTRRHHRPNNCTLSRHPRTED